MPTERAVSLRKKLKPAPQPVAEAFVPESLDDPRLYLNRELSLLAFQRRVLEEAQDPSNPLLDRVKFCAIVASNLHEFFMVRVAALMHQVEAGVFEMSGDAMPPSEQLKAIRSEAAAIIAANCGCLQNELLPALSEAGIRLLNYGELTARQRNAADRYFRDVVFPVLTPLAVDPGRPFPHISNLSLNLAVLIRDKKRVERFARVKSPDTLQQFVLVESEGSRKVFVWLEQVIAANLDALFPGMEVVEAHPFHVTRDADIAIQELEAADLLETIEEGVRQRRFGSVVRLEVDSSMPPSMLEILVSNLEIEPHDVFRIEGPLALDRLMKLFALDRPDLKETPFVPRIPARLNPKVENEDFFGAIRSGDILLHHPFDSFEPVVDFLRRAARDPHVLAIKMTLYRIGRNSPVVEALLEAMENEKQVAVLVELKARFDEESNIEWARALEREGVHVVYGLLGLKIHSKIAMVVRREGETIRRYVHLSTGNYNPVTSHLYTDLGFFTCDDEIGADATDLFNYLTGYSAKLEYRKLLVAPINLRSRFEELVRREMEHQRSGGHGHLILKMNALSDMKMVRLLYEASQAGVRIDLLVRGVCCLRPGIAGVSDNIRVTSIVGRFLEHSRIFYFHNGGEEEIYAGSADLMTRNISRRVEVLFPIEDPSLIRMVRDKILAVYLNDNVKARQAASGGSYSRAARASDEPGVSSQAVLLRNGLKKR